MAGVANRLELQNHAVVGRHNAIGKLRREFIVIDINVQMGQDRPFRPHLSDPGQRFCHRQMARVRRVAQRIQDPDIEIAQIRQRLIGQIVQVAGIGDAADAQSQRIDIAVNCRKGWKTRSPPGPLMVTGARFSITWPCTIAG